MAYADDLNAGAGLAFVGAMVEAIGGTSVMTASTSAALTTLGGLFLVIGPIIIGFGLYERFFASQLKTSASA